MNLFARWCGHHDQIRELNQKLTARDTALQDSATRLERTTTLRDAAYRRLEETSTELKAMRAQRDALTELVQDTIPDLDAVIDLLINAKRATGLNHSGPALARQRIDQAINILEGEK